MMKTRHEPKTTVLTDAHPGEALDAPSKLFDCLASGRFPNTLFKLPTDGSIIVDVSGFTGGNNGPAFNAALEEIGEPTGRKNVWWIDHLPRARIWSSKCWGFVFDETDAKEWSDPK